MQDRGVVVLVSSPATGDHCSETPKSVCDHYQPEISDPLISVTVLGFNLLSKIKKQQWQTINKVSHGQNLLPSIRYI